jgi:LmbE family N-acetylglucosaminyl deacetylase
MLDLAFNLPGGRPPVLLFIGAHADDIEIGCGGAVVELLKRHPGAQVHWVVLSSENGRDREARKAARALLKGAGSVDLRIEGFRGAYFPAEFAAIKDYFESLKRAARPDVVFCHGRDELHQDHRIVGELAWNTFRDHLILEYEIPKYDGGLGTPQLYVPLSATAMKRKLAVLMDAFPSQHCKRWFTPETFQGLARLRGLECNAASGYAEAFYARKLLLGGGGP